MRKLFSLSERIRGYFAESDQPHTVEKEIITSDDARRRFQIDVGTQVFQKAVLQRHHKDQGNDSWYSIVSVTYLQLDENRMPANIVVSAYKSDSSAVPGVRVTYLPDGAISRVDPDWLVTYDESLARQVPPYSNLPERLDFQATVESFEQQILDHNFEFPQLIPA